MKRIAFINSKGGCGKTTSMFHISGVLADMGKHVLVIDLDTQGDATNALLAEEESQYDTNGKNVFDFFKGDATFEEVMKHNYLKKRGCRKASYVGIDVLPFCPKLDDEKELEKERLLNEIDLSDKISTFSGYDFVLMDCPPSNKAIEKIVFEQLAEKILVPMSSDLDSIRGYGALVEKVDKAREKNENLSILGIYMSMYNYRVSTQREILSLMQQNFDVFLDVQIPMCSALVDSKLDGRPISFYKKSAAKAPVEQITQKILERL